MIFNHMLDKIVDLFRSQRQDVPDLLQVLGLAEWYLNLSAEEHEKLHEYSTAFEMGGEYNQLEQSVKGTDTI